MIIKQCELKDYKVKALVSGDKGLRLTIDINLENNELNLNELANLCHRALVIEVKEDEITGKY